MSIRYRICQIRIIIPETSDEIIEELSLDSPKKLDIVEEPLEIPIKLDNIEEPQNNNINITINNIPKKIIEYDEHFVSITVCYYWKPTNNKIEDLSKIYLLGTNILVNNSLCIPSFKIVKKDTIKYKKLVREYCKSDLNLANKDISCIKHLNNKENYHNYLVLLKRKKKLINKYKNTLNSSDKNANLWRTFYGMYYPEKINPLISDMYSKLSKYKYVGNVLKIGKNTLCVNEIYKTLSIITDDEIY
jgi:hypothetical protein